MIDRSIDVVLLWRRAKWAACKTANLYVFIGLNPFIQILKQT